MTTTAYLLTHQEKGLVEIQAPPGKDPKQRAAGVTLWQMSAGLRRLKKQVRANGNATGNATASDSVELKNGTKLQIRPGKHQAFQKGHWKDRVGEWWRFLGRKLNWGGSFIQIQVPTAETQSSKTDLKKLLTEIEALSQKLPVEMRLDVATLKGADEAELKDYHQFFSGLIELRDSKTRKDTETALNKILFSTGRNSRGSCAFITGTHADRLASGIKTHRIEFDDEHSVAGYMGRILWTDSSFWQGGMSKFIGTSKHYKRFLKGFNIDTSGTSDQNYLFNSEGVIHSTRDWKALQQDLLNRPNGTMAILWTTRAGGDKHMTLLVNIHQEIFHINNAMEMSAVVESFPEFIKGHYADQNKARKAYLNNLFDTKGEDLNAYIDGLINPNNIDQPLPEYDQKFGKAPLSSPIVYCFRADRVHPWLLKE